MPDSTQETEVQMRVKMLRATLASPCLGFEGNLGLQVAVSHRVLLLIIQRVASDVTGVDDRAVGHEGVTQRGAQQGAHGQGHMDDARRVQGCQYRYLETLQKLML
jgi:hypothetical protein